MVSFMYIKKRRSSSVYVKIITQLRVKDEEDTGE